MGRPASQERAEHAVEARQGAGTPAPQSGEGGRVELTLPYPPTANLYWRRHGSIIHLSAEARAYRETVRLLARGANVQRLVGPLRMTLHFYRPRRLGDLMNFEKQLSDALEGFAFEDDRQFREAHLFQHEDKQNPRVEVLLEELR